MSGTWFRAAGWILGLALGCVCGCIERPWLVQQTPAAPPPYVMSASQPGSVIQQTSGRLVSPQQARVDEVGRRLLEANKQLALKPRLVVSATPNLEIGHRGDHQVIVTEALVNACQTDGQLAAVLAVELGHMVAERSQGQHANALEAERLPPMDVPIGPDGGGFGGQARQAELAKLGYGRRKSEALPAAPAPEILGQQILVRSGYPASEIAATAALRGQSSPTQR